MRARELAVLASIVLTGCVSNGTRPTTNITQDAGPFPDSYKTIVQAEMRKTYFDPYSIKDVSISTPIIGNLPYQSKAGKGWLVCVEMNAKNRLGGYVGLKKDVFLIRNGAIVGGESEKFITEDICKNQVMSPWRPSFAN